MRFRNRSRDRKFRPKHVYLSRKSAPVCVFVSKEEKSCKLQELELEKKSKRRKERPGKKIFHAVSTHLCLIYYHDHDTSCIKTVELKGGRNFNGFPDMEVQYRVQSKAGSCFCTFHEKGHEMDQI